MHINIKNFLLERMNARGVNLSDVILSKLKNEDEYTEFTQKEVDVVKKGLDIKNYALFFSQIKPSNQEAKFRKFIEKPEIDEWAYKQLDWAKEKREIYLDFLEETGQTTSSLFASYLIEIEPFKNDIIKVANFFREKLDEVYLCFSEIGLNDELFFRKFMYAIEKMGILILSGSSSRTTIDGFCLKENIYPIIFFNASLGFKRTIFTIAHELAHLIFDDFSSFDKIDKHFGDIEGVETRANQFAAHFLMPIPKLRERIDYLKSETRKHAISSILDDLSKLLHISKEAIYYQLRNYSLLDNDTLNEIEVIINKKQTGFGVLKNALFHKPIAKFGILPSFNFILAKNNQQISAKTFYRYFENYKGSSLEYDYNRVERAFIEGTVV